jgi:uncharacterized protein (UPF0332 family)
MRAFDWTKYLELAEELSKRVTDESALRTAISRAYYSVFNTARLRPSVVEYRFPEDGQSHGEVWALYERNTNQDCKMLATVGQRLKRKRVQADYRAVYTRIEDDVPVVLEEAKMCAALLAKLDTKYPEPVGKTYSF